MRLWHLICVACLWHPNVYAGFPACFGRAGSSTECGESSRPMIPEHQAVTPGARGAQTVRPTHGKVESGPDGTPQWGANLESAFDVGSQAAGSSSLDDSNSLGGKPPRPPRRPPMGRNSFDTAPSLPLDAETSVRPRPASRLAPPGHRDVFLVVVGDYGTGVSVGFPSLFIAPGDNDNQPGLALDLVGGVPDEKLRFKHLALRVTRFNTLWDLDASPIPEIAHVPFLEKKGFKNIRTWRLFTTKYPNDYFFNPNTGKGAYPDAWVKFQSIDESRSRKRIDFFEMFFSTQSFVPKPLTDPMPIDSALAHALGIFRAHVTHDDPNFPISHRLLYEQTNSDFRSLYHTQAALGIRRLPTPFVGETTMQWYSIVSDQATGKFEQCLPTGKETKSRKRPGPGQHP
ncbi:MAG: hypothetical protein M1833_006702 [Piccolia ochrophora]|nr:MAG: hypothetical protein M1833_006702 [Piccolia ochrophora]